MDVKITFGAALCMFFTVQGIQGNQKCYACTTPKSGACGESFDNSAVGVLEIDCAGKCYTDIYELLTVKTYARGCMLSDTCEGSSLDIGGGVVNINIEHDPKCCTGDLCNDATTFAFPKVLAIMCSLLLLANGWRF